METTRLSLNAYNISAHTIAATQANEPHHRHRMEWSLAKIAPEPNGRPIQFLFQLKQLDRKRRLQHIDVAMTIASGGWSWATSL